MTEHILTGFAVNVAEIVFVEKFTAPVILAEGAVFPVDAVVETGAEITLYPAVFSETFFIDHNLPACAAGIRAVSCNTGKFFIIIRFCNLHMRASLIFPKIL